MLLPHRNLLGHPDVVTASEWTADDLPVGSFVPWHPGLDVDLRSVIRIDRRAATEILAFDPIGQATLVVEWASDSTRLRECCSRVALAEEMNLAVVLPGDRIGGKVTVRRKLVSDGMDPTDDTFLPFEPGAILWEDESDFRVEGTGPQFPVITTSFAGAGLAPEAVWAVTVPDVTSIDASSFAEPAAEHVSVRLNCDHPLTVRIAESWADEAAALARGVISCELARGVVSLARSPDFEMDASGPGSLGALVTSVLQQLGFAHPDELAWRDTEDLAALIQERFLVKEPG